MAGSTSYIGEMMVMSVGLIRDSSGSGGQWRCPRPVVFLTFLTEALTLNDLLVSPTFIDASVSATSKRHLLLLSLAQRVAAPYGVEERDVLEALQAREQEGSTGAGDGVAIPHAKLERPDPDRHVLRAAPRILWSTTHWTISPLI